MTKNIFIRNDRMLEIDFMYGIIGNEYRFTLTDDNSFSLDNSSKIRIINCTKEKAYVFIGCLQCLCKNEDRPFVVEHINAGDAIEFPIGQCKYKMRYIE